MTKEKVCRIIIYILTAFMTIFAVTSIVSIKKVDRLQNQIDILQGEYTSYIVLTYRTGEEEFFYAVPSEISVYDALLFTGDFSIDDFITFSETDIQYYFGSDDPLKYAKTDVLELIGNDDYYDEWDTLIVGLNNIYMESNYTVVFGYW